MVKVEDSSPNGYPLVELHAEGSRNVAVERNG
jgi:hypothetical protein